MPLHYDTDYPNLAAALAGAAGRILVISSNHVITTAHTVPARTHLLGNGGKITMSQPDLNALEIGGDNVTVEGVEIVGPSTPDTPSGVTVSNGIYAEAWDNLTVTGCLIRQFDCCGIFIHGCRNTTLRDNRLHSNRYGLSDSSDICLYSGDPEGGRIVIEGNFCLSNNSQGIYVDALGHDADVTLGGNVCVATDGGGDELAALSVERRHGIIIGYGSPVEGNGRVAVIGNLCRNTAVTGIYVASSAELRRGVVIIGNICSLNGLDETSLAGGIFIQGGGVETLVANNAVFDFRGTAAFDVGCIVVNHNIEGVVATATLTGNVCDTSTADGIVLKSRSAGLRVFDNMTSGIARYDLYEVPGAGSAFGGHRVERNSFTRSNADFPSVKISASTSTQTTWLLDNVITGVDGEENDADNTGILIEGGIGTKPVIASGNEIRNFYQGILNAGYITGRYESLLRFDNNLFAGCHDAIVLSGTSTAPCMVVEGNRFLSVVNPLSGAGGLGGASVGYPGRRDNGRLVLLGLNAAPGVGTWAVGDRAEFTTPGAGGNIGAVCTGAGNPGTWKTYGAIAA